MARVTVTLEVRDDFEPGWCDACPLAYEESSFDEDDGYDYWTSCVLGNDCEHCPLEVQHNTYWCSYEDTGLKPCETQAMDCKSCEYYSLEVK